MNNNINDNNSNCLAFSPSSNVTMELSSSSSSSNYFHSPISQLNYGICYGVHGEHTAPFYPPFSAIPPLTTHHPQVCEVVSSSTPKLEDFFGGATMGCHHYESNNESSIFCNETPLHEPNNNNQGFANLENWVVQSSNENGCINAMGYGDLQSLRLSMAMSPGSQSSCVTVSQHVSPAAMPDSSAIHTKKRGNHKQIVQRKSLDTFGQRTSQYRGVTRHRWTGRYEAHLWDNSCKKEGQSRKGRQVYLGGYDKEEKAARSYDLAALKYWGPSTHINFPLENYPKELEEMKNMSRQEYVAHLRRRSSGFSRGASIYRGVTRHHQHGRWQARIGRVAGNKDLYLGTFSTQEEAAEAYDIAAIKFRGLNAVTNFDITRYDVDRIIESNTLLSGDLAKRKQQAEFDNESLNQTNAEVTMPLPSHIISQSESDWKMALLYQSSQQLIPKPQFSSAITDDGSQQPGVEDSGKMGAHFSNASSMVTSCSLSSSREESLDKTSLSMVFGMPQSTATPTSNMNSWIASGQQLRAANCMTQLPVFAAWTET